MAQQGFPVTIVEGGFPVSVDNVLGSIPDNTNVSEQLAEKDIYGRGLYRDFTPSNIGTRIQFGRMATLAERFNNSVRNTFQVTMALPQHCDGIRLVLANSDINVAMTYIFGKVVAIPDASDINASSSSNWLNITKGGLGGFSIPNATQSGNISYLLTDWIPLESVPRTDGGTFPLITARVSIDTNTISTYGNGIDNFTNWATKPDGRIWTARNQTGAHITTTTGFTSTTNVSQSPIVGIQFMSRGKVVNIGAVGDSITEGIGTYIGEGFGNIIANELSDMNDVTFCYSNFGWSGQSSPIFMKRAIDILNSELKPDVLLYPLWSPNDAATTITDVTIANLERRVQRIMFECKKTKTPLILWTGLPTNTAVRPYGSSDALRVAYNNKYLALNSKDFVVVDTASVINGSTSGGQVQMLPSLTDDGIHPNTLGIQAMANVIKPVILKILGI